MAAATYFDDLIRDYLLFRGFTSTLKAYEAELKSDKDKGFRVDKIVDQLCSYVSSYDLVALREAWGHLDQRLFSRLEHQFVSTVRKLENGILKMYIINAVQTNRNDKLLEFFETMSPDLQSQADWKEWFVLPFTKNPEENPTFSMYFTRQWQDTILVSLHNFLSVIFQSMPLPTLMSYEEEQVKISQLIEENDLLKKKLEAFEGKESAQDLYSSDAEYVVSATTELMDDFYVIAQEAPPIDRENKTIRSFIRNISSGLPTSPILGRKQHVTLQPSGVTKKRTGTDELGSVVQSKYVISRSKPRTTSSPLPSSGATVTSKSDSDAKRGGGSGPGKTDPVRFSSQRSAVEVSCTAGLAASTAPHNRSSHPGYDASASVEGCDSKSPFLLLSQEVYGEHHSAITHCKFNASGSVVASSDVNGIIKIWSPSPSPQTLATVISKSSVLALEWANRLERLLLLGNRAGAIRLYDTKEKKTLCEVGMESATPFREQRITCLACNPSETTFICCAMGKPRVPLIPGTESVPVALPEGRITIWDMKLMMLQKTLSLEPSSAVVNSCVFNHNGQLLLVVAADGRIRLFDMRCHECIATWQGHQGNAYSVQFSPDETSCYSIGEDGKFVQWSVNKTGQKILSVAMHDGAAGPFTLPDGGIGAGAGAGLAHRPVGKLFTSDAEGKHLLTCSKSGGLIYSLSQSDAPQLLVSLGGHKSPVVTVDWATTMDCGICTTASLDGQIQVSTLLAQ